MSRHDPPACSVSVGGGPLVRGGRAARARRRAPRGVHRLQPHDVGAGGRSALERHLGDRSNRRRLSLAGYRRRPDSIRWRPVRSWEALGLPPLPGVAVRAVSSSRDGSVWLGFGAPGGVVRLQKGELRHYGPGEGLEEGAVTMLFEHPDGTLWAGNPTRPVQPGRTIAGNGSTMACRQTAVYTAYVDKSGGFLVGTALGTFRRSPGENRFERTGAFSETVQGISEDALRHGLGERSDCRFSKASRTRDARAFRRRKRAAAGSLHDRRGNLWVGTFGQGPLARAARSEQADRRPSRRRRR